MVKKLASKAYIILMLGLIYAPILMIIVYSFSNTNNFTFPEGFTFDAYISLFTDAPQKLWSSLRNTIVIAVIASVASTVLGSISAVGIYYLRPTPKKIVENVNQLPIINSEIVVAVSLMMFFGTFGFPQGYIRLIFGHISFCTPYVILSVMPRLMQMDPNVYEAALDLGANPIKALFKVILPIILPGILSGFVMAFTISLDDFIITQLNKGASTGIDTLSTYLYSSLRNASGLKPFWLPVFSIIILVVVLVLLLANLRSFKGSAKVKEEVKK